jgi:hypothetical protein
VVCANLLLSLFFRSLNVVTLLFLSFFRSICKIAKSLY